MSIIIILFFILSNSWISTHEFHFTPPDSLPHPRLQALWPLLKWHCSVAGTKVPSLGFLLITLHHQELCAGQFALFSSLSACGGWKKQASQKSYILQPFCIFCVNDCEFYFSLAMGEANKQFTSMRTYLRPNLFLTDDSTSLPLASKKARWALLTGSNAASPIVCNWSRRDTAISVIASLCSKAFVFVKGFVLIWARRHVRVSSVIKIGVDSYFTGKSASKREQGKCAFLHRRNLKKCFQYLL